MLIHITVTPSAREISRQLRSGPQGCALHYSSGFKPLASIQQDVEDKLKAFVLQCEGFAIIYCQESTPEVEYDAHKYSDRDMGFSI